MSRSVKVGDDRVSGKSSVLVWSISSTSMVKCRQPRCACVPRAILPRRVPRIYQVVAARDEGSVVGGEEGHEVGYLFRRSQAPESVERGYLRLGLRRKVLFQQRRGDKAGAHRVYVYPSAACSRAAAFVKPTTPCLDAT